MSVLSLCLNTRADDIALLAETIGNFIKKNRIVWIDNCYNWQFSINVNKSKAMHFMKWRVASTKVKFMLGEPKVDLVQQYKYLEILVSEISLMYQTFLSVIR